MSWQSWKRSTARRSIASSGSSSTAKTTIPRRCSMATRFSPTVVGRTTTLSRRPGRRLGRLQHRHALGAFAMTARANGGKVQHVMAPARLATSDGPRPMGFGQREAAGLPGGHPIRHRPALAVTEGGCMAIDYDSLMSWRFPPVRQTLTKTDCIRYALGVGLGGDPLDTAQLRFVYEEGLEALPTMAVVLAYPGFWVNDPATGIDWVRVVHGEQAITLHRPLPVEAELVRHSRVTGIVDKGAGKGAILYSEREISDTETGELYATLAMSTFCRGDGGFGGPSGPSGAGQRIPHPAPEDRSRLTTPPPPALLYRLTGDFNPLHADPEVARAARFDRPILHGLCTLRVAGHALLRTCCDYDPARLRSLALRFSAPVFPGETIRTEMWRDGATVSFRARVIERDVVVLNNGRMELA